MTEQLAFQQARGNGGAIYLHERAVPSFTALVNRLRNQFLASSCFPGDQHRRIGRPHQPHQAEYAPESGAVSDNAGQPAVAEFVAFQFELR